MLFIDYSSVFNTRVLITKLRVQDFLTGRPQVVKVRNNTSATLILNTGVPQGCVVSSHLYTPC